MHEEIVAGVDGSIPEKQAGGRPTLYDPSFVQTMLDYFDIEPYTEVPKVFVNKKGEETTTYEDRPNDLPTYAGFARKIGVSRDTLHEWANAKNPEGTLIHPGFSDAYARVKDMQDDHLVQNALRGHFNPQFSIFFAKNCLSDRYKDKTETDVNIKKDGAAELANGLMSGDTAVADDHPLSDDGATESHA